MLHVTVESHSVDRAHILRQGRQIFTVKQTLQRVKYMYMIRLAACNNDVAGRIRS